MRTLLLRVAFAASVGCSSSSDVAESGPSGSGGASGSGALGSDSSPASRTNMACPAYLKSSEEKAASVKFPVKTEAGSWGGLPANFQVLPSGATLCGAIYFLGSDGKPLTTDSVVTVAIQSPLYGAALKAEYDRIFSGCPFSMDNSRKGQTNVSWDCPKDKGGLVTLVTDASHNYYIVGTIIP